MRDDHDLPAGIPSMCAPPVAVNDMPQASPAISHSGRDSSKEPVPLDPPVTKSVPPEEVEKRDNKQKIEDEAERIRCSSDPSADDESELWRLVRRICVAFVIGGGGVCGWLICAQLVQVIAIVATWGGAVGNGAWLLLGIFLAIVVFSVVRLVGFWWKYRRHRPIARLETRKQLRSFAERNDDKHKDDVKRLLIAYMRDYKLDEPGELRFLRRKGIDDAELKMMSRAWYDLSDGNNRKESDSWIKAVQAQFVRPLDDAAASVVRKYAAWAALKTAASPYALLDIAIVIYLGAGMLGTLSRLYKVSADPFATLYLFGLVLTQAFFAGRVEEHSADMEQWLDGSLKDILEQAGQVVPDLAANLLGKLTVKASQGLANGLLLHRIGREACRLLRPLPMPSKK